MKHMCLFYTLIKIIYNKAIYNVNSEIGGKFMKCLNCGREMINIKSFTLNKSYQMNSCKCGKRTKHEKIHYDKNGRIIIDKFNGGNYDRNFCK